MILGLGTGVHCCIRCCKSRVRISKCDPCDPCDPCRHGITEAEHCSWCYTGHLFLHCFETSLTASLGSWQVARHIPCSTATHTLQHTRIAALTHCDTHTRARIATHRQAHMHTTTHTETHVIRHTLIDNCNSTCIQFDADRLTVPRLQIISLQP